MSARRSPIPEGGLHRGHCGAEDEARLLEEAARLLAGAGCVFAEAEARVILNAARTPDELEAMVRRRVSGLPLEQVVGWAEFRGLRIAVEPGVFVPRRRSEFLVRTAIALTTAAGPVIVDLCCGTGALGVATAKAFSHAELHAADIDAAAVRCARRNVLPAGGHVYQGDLFAPLPTELRKAVAVLICNAPYVPTDEVPFLPPEARDYEPHVALDGGSDGLAVLRRVAAQAPRWLAPGGHLLVETSDRQASLMADAMARAGLSPRVHSDDELGASVVTGTRCPRGGDLIATCVAMTTETAIKSGLDTPGTANLTADTYYSPGATPGIRQATRRRAAARGLVPGNCAR